jgi:isopentenyl-diphosphate delta-isomerase
MNAHPIIIPAIAEDGSLYPVEKLKAHEDGLFHLAISIFVFDGEHLLIQKRAASKYHCGGLWANTCCSHPYWDEPIDSCARRRLREELGFNVPLSRRRVVEYSADVGGGLHEHEKVTMYVGSADRNSIESCPIRLRSRKRAGSRLHDLPCRDRRQPESFTPWFRIYAERYPDLVF